MTINDSALSIYSVVMQLNHRISFLTLIKYNKWIVLLFSIFLKAEEKKVIQKPVLNHFYNFEMKLNDLFLVST